MDEIKSPCMKICFRDSNDVCFGCRRTGEEVGKWSQYSNEEKKAVIAKTYQRTNVAGEMPPGNFLR
ncbi:MAG: DUF1289 domain-containing protein [Bacteroidales bacterium]|nr:DUF1289 domain-containing protein [Bacteroidales bacterium]